MRKYLVALFIVVISLYSFLLRNWTATHYYSHKIAVNAKEKGLSEQETVDYVRRLVHRNTTHLPLGNDDPHTTNDPVSVLKSVYNGEGTATTCGPRAAAMKAVLQKLGFESRAVHVFTDDYDGIRSHTFLEVWLNGVWQAQDPDYDIIYVDEDGQRANTEQILRGLASPLNGWPSIELQHYFEIAMYDKRPDTSLMLVNSTRFDLEHYFPINEMNFPEFAQVYGDLEWQTLSQ